jgi:hypothetical protein
VSHVPAYISSSLVKTPPPLVLALSPQPSASAPSTAAVAAASTAAATGAASAQQLAAANNNSSSSSGTSSALAIAPSEGSGSLHKSPAKARKVRVKPLGQPLGLMIVPGPSTRDSFTPRDSANSGSFSVGSASSSFRSKLHDHLTKVGCSVHFFALQHCTCAV